MGQYGKAAIQATNIFIKENIASPNEAWDAAIDNISSSVSSQKKGCPKNAYLGLCEEGMLKGIPSGKYCKSSNNKNKKYALTAIALLEKYPNYLKDKKELWKLVMQEENEDQNKVHNDQMDVVIALWEEKFIRNL